MKDVNGALREMTNLWSHTASFIRIQMNGRYTKRWLFTVGIIFQIVGCGIFTAISNDAELTIAGSITLAIGILIWSSFLWYNQKRRDRIKENK